MTVDLCSLIDRNAAFAPDKTAIAFEGNRLSYAAFAARIERTATALKREFGIGRGDRVAILSLNRPDYLVLLYACARLGAMLVPLNWRLAGAEHTVLFGLDWNDQRAKANRYIGPAPGLDLLNPVYGVPIPTPTQPLANYRQTIRQAGLYLQDQIKLDDHWIVTLGGRQDRVTATTDDRLNGTYTRVRDNAFSGRAGLTYVAANGVAPYVSYSESFLPSSGVDGDGNPFKPSRGKQVEVGVKYQPAGSRSLYTVAVFDLNKTNIVSYNPITNEQRQIGKQPELERDHRDPQEQIEHNAADIVYLAHVDPDLSGHLPDIPNDRPDDHGADIDRELHARHRKEP